MPAVSLFISAQTQWRISFGGYVGLDYVGVEATARLLRVELEPDLFRRVQVLEGSFMSGIAAAAERTRDDAPKPRRR